MTNRDDHQIGRILPKAYFLVQRVGAAKSSITTEKSCDETCTSRLQTWLQFAGAGRQENLARRLELLGCPPESVSRLLEEDFSGPQVEGEEWIDTFTAVLRAGREFSNDTSPYEVADFYPFEPQDALPFEELWLPFLDVARHMLIKRSGNRYLKFPLACRHSLERQLLQRLGSIGASAAHAAFSAYRDRHDQPVPASSDNLPRRSLYLRFVADHLETGRLFEEYCVLARLLSIQVEFWVGAVQVFLGRLEKDFPDILTTFTGCDSFPGKGLDPQEGVFAQVASVTPGLSDPHEQGQTVIRIEFCDGARLVYKPKSIDIEDAYGKFIDWINACGPERDLKYPICLPRASYGWVEYIEHRPCASNADASDYFFRSGMLCALFYILRGIDYQEDNLIACGAHPVPIDHEMLLYPPEPEQLFRHGRGSPRENGQDKAGKTLLFRHSVIKTKLLPVWQTRPDGQKYNVGALESNCRERPLNEVFAWHNINTDAMAPGSHRESPVLEKKGNVPVLHGKPLLLADYMREFIQGFRSAYKFMERMKGILLGQDGPLSVFKGKESRYLFRPTSGYLSMLNLATQSGNMKNALDFDIFLERLWGLLSASGRWDLAYIVDFEKRAMQQLDVPRMTTAPDQCSLANPGNKAAIDLFECSGLELTREGIQGLCRKDMDAQIRLINLLVACYREGRTPVAAEMEGAFSGCRP